MGIARRLTSREWSTTRPLHPPHTILEAHVRHRTWLVLVLALAALLLLPAAASAMTYDEAVDALVAEGYPLSVETTLTGMGTSPIGMAFGGSSADTARAEFLAGELEALGFNVRLEPVPLDVMEFKGASVTIPAHEPFVASTFGGVRGTPEGGITAPIVYVGGGTAKDVADALELAGLDDLSGKIALVDARLSSYWMNWQWTEPVLAGAVGVIYTSTLDDQAYYAEPTSLGSFDAEYRYELPPVVYISRADGDTLKATLTATPGLEATMVNDVPMTLASEGGHGFNVVATLPGSVKGAGRIVIGAHHDAYFHAGMDDTGGCTNALLMAKAMVMSEYKPARSITFLLTTGEEYGATNAYYDWLIGAWHAITQRHPNWAGSTPLMINLESMAMTGAPLETRATPEVAGLIQAAYDARHAELDSLGTLSIKNVNCWNDQWTFTAAGVPSMYFRARTGEYGYKWYHTNFDTIDLMDYDYLADINKLVFGIAQQFDTGLLPYDLAARAVNLDDNVDAAALKDAGSSAKKADRLEKAVAKFNARATAYMARAPQIRERKFWSVNVRLVNIEKKINKAFTALDVWDTTVYPHAQVQWDLEQINAALEALTADPVDPVAAIEALKGVGITNPYGLDFSHENYLMQLETHAKGWSGGLFWGAQGHLSPYLDVVPVIDMVNATAYDDAVASLEAMKAMEVKDLNKRLVKMSATLAGVNGVLSSLK
jgi:hypothetical protein